VDASHSFDYCIKFKALKDIHVDVLEAAILSGVEATNEKE